MTVTSLMYLLFWYLKMTFIDRNKLFLRNDFIKIVLSRKNAEKVHFTLERTILMKSTRRKNDSPEKELFSTEKDLRSFSEYF